MERREQNKHHRESLYHNLEKNIATFRSLYENCDDVIFRSFTIGKTKAVLIYIDNLSHVEEINENVLTPLTKSGQNHENMLDGRGLKDYLARKLPVSSLDTFTRFEEGVTQLAVGHPLLLMDKHDWGYYVGLPKWEKRAVSEPTTEPAIRGPQEGFTETLADNIAMIRRKIGSSDLKIESMTIGKQTKTRVILAYMQNTADAALVQEAKRRLRHIEADSIMETGYIEEFIEDNPCSPFPQVQPTERVDAAASGLVEGRVAILVNGTPIALIVPTTLVSMMQASDDYYNRSRYSSMIRVLRFCLFFVTLTLPGIYVALMTFHQEMIPTHLLISIIFATEAIPFPVLVEALMMQIAYEALREAGLRLPRQIGSAVTIVGALVIGEAAVQAGFVSAPIVIVIATTGISTFVFPRFYLEQAIRELRLLLIVLGGVLGMLGILLGLIGIAIHLCKLHSFGVPYLKPLSPLQAPELQDSFIRVPWPKMKRRPRWKPVSFPDGKNGTRQTDGHTKGGS